MEWGDRLIAANLENLGCRLETILDGHVTVHYNKRVLGTMSSTGAGFDSM